MMNINQLPIEILIKIFGFLPAYENVSLVNKNFHDVVVKVTMNNPNSSLTVTQDFYVSDDFIFDLVKFILKSTN